MTSLPADLDPPDLHYLRAAIGWLELGNAREAQAELARVDPRHRHHPRVLEVGWMIRVREEDWSGALAAAETEVVRCPGNASGWLHRAYAIRRVEGGGLEAAWKVLRPAYEQFPEEPTIPFNLACYACQLGRPAEARKWLHCAMKIGGPDPIRRLALSDPDLQPLWPELGAE